MHQVRLIYASVMTEACDTEALFEILKESRANNAANKVTGILCYDPAYFLQCLEGPREAVNALYAAINNDPRHKNVTLLEYADMGDRIFGDWSMGFLPSGILEKDLLPKYADGGAFNPFALSAEQARAFLIEVVETKREDIKK